MLRKRFAMLGALFALPALGTERVLAIGQGTPGQDAPVKGYSLNNWGVSGASDNNAGVHGESLNGHGVEGVGHHKAGVIGTSIGGHGVSGQTQNPTAAGIVGIGHRAALFQGNVGVNGIFAVHGFKAFQIDHPLDPAEKYLTHSSIESSEMLNVYSGTATLDARGEAVVHFPDWFSALNCDFRYQLTSIGAAAAGLHVAQKMEGGRFRIGGGNPGGEVSWQVSGVRQDAWAQANPLRVEQEKPPDEKGAYAHPEVFGQPRERSIAWRHFPDLMLRREDHT